MVDIWTAEADPDLVTRGYEDDFASLRIPLSASAVDTLRWWRRQLEDPLAFHQLYPIGPLRDEHIFVDASISWGIGIVIGRRWYSFKLAEGWRRDIRWARKWIALLNTKRSASSKFSYHAQVAMRTVSSDFILMPPSLARWDHHRAGAD